MPRLLIIVRNKRHTLSQAFAKEVELTGSTDLTLLSDDTNKHTPDGSFWDSQAEWPGVVIEVTFSQSTKNLDRLA